MINLALEVKKPEPRIKLVNRNQNVFYPINIEQLIDQDHPIRGIWEFVNNLDLSKFYEEIKAVEGRAGRSKIDPKILITIWIYSYSIGVTSSREISRLCDYHPAYKWLTAFEKINYHTISDFRIKNKEALDGLFVQILGVLNKEGLIDLETVMQDGTKIKANAGIDTFRREKTLNDHLEKAQKYIEQANDPEKSEQISTQTKEARKRATKEKKERLEKALEELKEIQATKTKAKEKEEVRVSMTDPESRKMKDGKGGYIPAYNVQIATDSKENIIVGVEAVQSPNDYNELTNLVDQVTKNLDKQPKQMVGDAGYTTRLNIIEMEKRGVDFIGSLRDPSKRSKGQLTKRGVEPDFYPENFLYNEEKNEYTCPMGQILRYETKEKAKGYINFKYRAEFEICQNCPAKGQCCPKNNTKGRSLIRKEEDHIVIKFISKMETPEAKEIYSKRGPIAEFPNLWIKQKNKLRQFSLRGKVKVSIETKWVCLTYNIQQWLRLCWRRTELELAA